jgi:hypothetical protein
MLPKMCRNFARICQNSAKFLLDISISIFVFEIAEYLLFFGKFVKLCRILPKFADVGTCRVSCPLFPSLCMLGTPFDQPLHTPAILFLWRFFRSWQARARAPVLQNPHAKTKNKKELLNLYLFTTILLYIYFDQFS